MKRRWIGYAVWLLLAACLYFFENNTGTRVVLLCSMLLPFIPFLRSAFFSPDESEKKEAPKSLTVKMFDYREPEETGEVRFYMPGDPVRRIHWKLSAKKDELLVRETSAEPVTEETEKRHAVFTAGQGRIRDKKLIKVLTAGIMISVLLLLLIPEASLGARELCNRLFAKSEAVNRYVYSRFPVPEHQSVFTAAILLICISSFVLAVTVILRSRVAVLTVMAACSLFQVYFGLVFPVWINILLYSLLAIRMMRRPVSRKYLIACGFFILTLTMTIAFFLPGVNAITETASERVRDRLALIAEQITGPAAEVPGGETETRHVHTRSMENGDREAETEREFRLVTEKEEQISMPHWVNWMKMILLLMLTVILLMLPFTPFLLLNARKKKAQEARKAFASENVSEAVQAVFRQIIFWIETVRRGTGNLLYRDWTGQLTENLPEGYTDRFVRCAADFEEAVYSDHLMPEQKREDAMDLLKETETVLWKTANRKQRIYLKYWMCLHE